MDTLKKTIIKLLPFILGGLIGLLFSLLNIRIPFFHLMMILAASVGAAFFHIVVHEAGHMISGWLTGYKFVLFRVGSLTLIRHKNTLQFKRYRIGGTGGQCLMEPPDVHNEDYRFPFYLYNLSGGLVNILFSTLFTVWAWHTPQPTTVVLIVFAAIGFFFGATNLIPRRIGGISNDGLNVLSCAKDARTRRAMWIQLKYAALSTQGVRQRDIPEAWISDTGDISNEAIGFLLCLQYDRLMDNEEGPAARALASVILSNPGKMMPLHQYILQGELLFHELINENRAEEVERMYTQALQTNLALVATQLNVLRLHYAYALLYEKDHTKAQKSLDAFNKACANHALVGEIPGELFWIQAVKNCGQPASGGSNESN